MARAIDADALKKALSEAIKDAPLYIQATVEQYIDEAPTLTPPDHFPDPTKMVQGRTNEPLTLEQLREMYGEPVWVTSARERGNIPSRWVLFAGVSKSKRNSDVFVFATTGGIAQGYEAVNYGKTWNAYRRPPEETEADHG